MAQYTVLNRKKNGQTVICFDYPQLKNYRIVCLTSTTRGVINTVVSFPTITFRHKDAQCALDVIQGLQLAANYITSIRGGGKSAFKLSGGEAVTNDFSVTAQVFKFHEYPAVGVILEDDDFYRWIIDGFRSGNNDAASLARIAGTVNNCIIAAQGLR
jgi:hypothetical protein